MKTNKEIKLTVADVAKATFVIGLGVKIGLGAADNVYKFVNAASAVVAEYLVHKIESSPAWKKMETNYEEEFKEAEETMDKIKKEMAEGESDS